MFRENSYITYCDYLLFRASLFSSVFKQKKSKLRNIYERAPTKKMENSENLLDVKLESGN